MIRVNGEEVADGAGATVAELVARLAPSGKGVAVAVNGDVVPRSVWGHTRLAEGDRVEILTAAQGG